MHSKFQLVSNTISFLLQLYNELEALVKEYTQVVIRTSEDMKLSLQYTTVK